MTKCDSIEVFLPYIISVLVERVNCHDLEGILQLPEVMRPPPGQKPKQLIKLIEESEEVSHCTLLFLKKKMEGEVGKCGGEEGG